MEVTFEYRPENVKGLSHENIQENSVPEKSCLDKETVEEKWLASGDYGGDPFSNWNVHFYKPM